MPDHSLGDIYLKLLNGRHTPDEVLDDRGFNGPTLGPFKWVHCTYACDIRFADQQGEEYWLEYHEDMVVYQGCYYGDFEIATSFSDLPSLPLQFPIKECEPKNPDNRWAAFSPEELLHLKCAAAEAVTSQLASDLLSELENELLARLPNILTGLKL
jgi:hypothetical protein